MQFIFRFNECCVNQLSLSWCGSYTRMAGGSQEGAIRPAIGRRNAKDDREIAFHLRLSFVSGISEYCLFLFMAIPRPATMPSALAGRGIAMF